MTPDDELYFYNSQYAWLRQQAKDPENDVTSDYESTDPAVDADAIAIATRVIQQEDSHPMALEHSFKPKSELDHVGYALVRAYGAPTGVAIIGITETPKYVNVLDTQIYDAFILAGANDTENAFPNVEPAAIVEITSGSRLPPELARIIWRYTREAICTITLKVSGNPIWTAPIYAFPFTDFPTDPLPGLSLFYSQMKLEFDPPLKEFTVSKRSIMVKNGPCLELCNRLYIPGYDAIALDGGWGRGDEWRASPSRYANRENGWTS